MNLTLLKNVVERELLKRRVENVLIRAQTKVEPLTTPNQHHAAAAVLRAARLVSVGNWLANKCKDRLALLQKEVAKDINSWARGSVEDELKAVAASVAKCFEWLKGELTDDANELAGILSGHARTAVRQHFNVSAVKQPSATSGASALVLGAPLSDHLDKIQSDLLFRLRAGIRAAASAGCTAKETVKRMGLDLTSDNAVSASLSGDSRQSAVNSDLIHAGDLQGHEFHGNQWITHGTVNSEADEVKSKQYELKGNHTRTHKHDFNYKKSDNRWVYQEQAPTFDKNWKQTYHHKAVRWIEEPTPEQKQAVEAHLETKYKIKPGRHILYEGSSIQATILASNPLTAINIGIRLFDTTDNSLMKFIQAALTALASDADSEGASADEERNMGWTWVSAADANVCPFCEFMDGGKWDANKDPVGDSPELEQEPPAHLGCRCALLPCDLDSELPSGDFESYLAHFSQQEQEQAFGKSALKAYRKGDLTPAQLMGQQENEISLEKFREMEPTLELNADKFAAMGRKTGEVANEVTQVRRLGLKASDRVQAASSQYGCLMAMLPALDSVLPNWAADNIPSETLTGDGIEMEPHCTVLYGFDLDFDSIALEKLLQEYGELKLKLGKLSRFECPEYDVLKFSVVSSDIKTLNRKLNKHYSQQITPSQHKFNPHVTVAYVKKGSNKQLNASDLEGNTFTIGQLLYSLPDEEGRRVIDLSAKEAVHA